MLLEKIATAISRVASVENSILKGVLTAFKDYDETSGGEWIINERNSEYLIYLKKITRNSIILEAVDASDENKKISYEVSLSVKKI